MFLLLTMTVLMETGVAFIDGDLVKQAGAGCQPGFKEA